MDIASYIRNIENFPKQGIQYKDITPLLLNAQAFASVIDQLAELAKPFAPQKICAIESRGFLFGMPLAQKLNIGFVPARKAGKLPAKVISQRYDLEYGQDELQVHKDAFEPSERVLIVDDVLATGGTAKATYDLVTKANAIVVGQMFLIELKALNGRDKLKEAPVLSLLSF